MKWANRILCVLMWWVSCLVTSAQTVVQPDTVIDMRYYKSYCVKELSTFQLIPSYTIYKIYNPTGKVSRSGMSFKGTNKHFNYNKSGYDKGHLVPAEDMSWNRDALLSTFWYVNCVPQTPKLNRGKWRMEEMKVHKLSLTDSLIVITGACDYDDRGIPEYCYKIYQQLSSKKIALIIYNQEGIQPEMENQEKKKFLEYFKKYLK